MADTFENSVLQLTAQQYWDRLDQIGWPDSIPDSQRAGLESRVKGYFEADPINAWESLALLWFDTECIYGLYPDPLSYTSRLLEVAQATDGIFHPTSIKEDLVEGEIGISFQHGERVYQFRAAAESDYFDTRILGPINEALDDSGARVQFISLPATDQMLRLVLILPETYRQAEREMLVPPPRYYIIRARGSVAEVNSYIEGYLLGQP